MNLTRLLSQETTLEGKAEEIIRGLIVAMGHDPLEVTVTQQGKLVSVGFSVKRETHRHDLPQVVEAEILQVTTFTLLYQAEDYTSLALPTLIETIRRTIGTRL